MATEQQAGAGMRFPDYQAFEARYQAGYGAALKEYPMTARCFELEIRNFMAGYSDIARRNLSRRADRFAGAEWVLRLAGMASHGDCQVYLDIPGSGPVRAALTQRFEAEGIGSFSDRTVLGVRANKVLHKLATMGAGYSEGSRVMASAGPDALVARRDLLDRIEGELSANFTRLTRYIARQRIKLFLAAGDAKPHSRMIIAAARALGLPYVVLAHGYISEPQLVSIAPLHADHIVVWTPRQQADLRAALPDRAAAIHCFGFPPRLGPLPAAGGAANAALLAWEPLLSSGLLERHAPVLARVAAQVRKAGLTPLFRPHPKERSDPRIRSLADQTGMVIDTSPLQDALAGAVAVISSNSTVLTEAAFAGRPAIQVAELAGYEFEGAIRLDAGQLADALGRPLDPAAVGDPFDTAAFHRFLSGLMAG